MNEEESLKKLANAEAVKKGLKKPGIGTLQRVNQRDSAALMRDPAKFNAMTFKKETGGRLD